MGCAGLLMPELDCSSTLLDRGVAAATLAALVPTTDAAAEWDEPIPELPDRETSLLACVAALLRGRSRAH